MTISIEWDKIANKLTEELCLEIALEDFVWDGGDLDIKGTVKKFKQALEDSKALKEYQQIMGMSSDAWIQSLRCIERLKKLIESSNKKEYIPFSEVQKILGDKK